MIQLSDLPCFANEEVASECQDTLKSILPDDYKYMVSEFALVERSKIVGENKFNTVFRVDVTKADDIEKFIEKLSEKSGTTYNKYCGDRKGSKKVIVWGYRKCHHNVRRHSLKTGEPRTKGPGRQPGAECIPNKNTGCPANFEFRLSGTLLHTSRKKKLSLTRQTKDEYPLEITLNFIHNHSINSADALRYRTVSEEVKNKFIELFSEDYTAASALAKYKEDLRLNSTEDEFTLKMANRSLVPDYFWVFHLHAQYIEKRYGTINGVDAYQRAVEKVKNFNEQHGSEVAKIAQTVEGEKIVAICDPFCQRVHERLPQAGDIILVDATSNLDRHDTKLFHIICPSPAGGLPLGNIVVSREDESTVVAGFELFKSLLPSGAFFGRGPEKGPKIAMTDDCQVEQNALRNLWQDITLLLCVFHLLQALWRWGWNSDHKIDKRDRPTLFNLFKKLLYAESEKQYNEAKTLLFSNTTTKKYPQFIEHLNKDVLPRKKEWALSERISKKLSTHNVNTTNYVEISFRLTKDNQFNRVKAYNLPDLLEILLDGSSYYVQRCIDIGNNRICQLQNQRSRYLAKKCKIDRNKIVVVDNGVPNSYLVPSEHVEGKFYEVNMDFGVCQCPIGMLRGPCKHKQVVAEHFNIASSDFVPENDPRVRAAYHYLATGKRQDSNWYRQLSQEDAIDDGTNDVFGFMRQESINQEPTLHVEDEASSSAVDMQDESFRDDVDMQDESFRDDVEDYVPDDRDVLKEEFEEAMSNFKDEVIKRIDADPSNYEKCVKSFSKQLKIVSSANHSLFQKSLFSFVDEKTMPVKRGRKRRAKNIPVQKNSKSRRLYKHRGSQGAPKGRPTRDIVKPKNPESIVYHCLPKQKKRKTKNPHSLTASVKANRASEKKH